MAGDALELGPQSIHRFSHEHRYYRNIGHYYCTQKKAPYIC